MGKLSIKKLSTKDADFKSVLQNLTAYEAVSDTRVEDIVRDILKRVKNEGDAAVLELTNKFDRMSKNSVEELMVTASELEDAFNRLSSDEQNTLTVSATRIREYHEHQSFPNLKFEDQYGNILGQKVTPLDRVGLYVPGGTAPLASSVLMNAIPAKVAGVKEVVMMSPTPDDVCNDLLFGAAHVAGITKMFKVGGAQAIAALTYGTECIPAVDKITGPGNAFVANAKQQVFGQVGIDMVAGPSEILVICDGKTNPDWIAMDLFSQAEHDTDAQSILITEDAGFIKSVEEAMEKLLPTMDRAEIIIQSLNERGAFIHVSGKEEAIEIANLVAAEHLEISVEEPQDYVDGIRHAGAMFIGRYTAEALGDYCAGPNHVLPTGGTTRFSSPLSVYDFQKRTSIIQCNQQGAVEIAKVAEKFAYGEGLDAHARSAGYRK